MVLQKGIDIHLGLPATGYPSAGKHVILEAAEPKIDIAAIILLTFRGIMGALTEFNG